MKIYWLLLCVGEKDYSWMVVSNYQVQQGVRMSPKVKRVDAMLKEMIEQDKL